MGCAISMVKYLLFIFNFVFALLGIAILAVGVWVHLELTDYQKITEVVGSPVIPFIVIGAIVFVIAFFGCCGAIRESHCMVVTYAVFLLTILIIQIAIGVWAFVVSSKANSDETSVEITRVYRDEIFVNYWKDEGDRFIVDAAQSSFSCCGVTKASDFETLGNSTIPWSCCGNAEGVACTTGIYSVGCATKLTEAVSQFATIIGGVLIGVAVTELVGIIFALCLANSIRNDDRRGYRV